MRYCFVVTFAHTVRALYYGNNIVVVIFYTYIYMRNIRRRIKHTRVQNDDNNNNKHVTETYGKDKSSDWPPLPLYSGAFSAFPIRCARDAFSENELIRRLCSTCTRVPFEFLTNVHPADETQRRRRRVREFIILHAYCAVHITPSERVTFYT